MKTILYNEHCLLGARMIDFAGWMMPLQYTSIIEEHLTVRSSVGLFDVSHMGFINIKGKDAEKFLDFIATNNILNKKNFTSIYSPICNSKGGCIDDIIIFKEDSENFFLITNASNRDNDLNHLIQYAPNYDVIIEENFSEIGILALQGPLSFDLLKEFLDIDYIAPFHFIKTSYLDHSIYISHTGYTGEKGVEIIAPNTIIGNIWNNLLLIGKKYSIKPIGLGARDTLRLEMGYALYSHELTEDITPIESVSKWAVKLSKDNFLGKEAIEAKMRSPILYAYGITMIDNSIPRSGNNVSYEGISIGKVTSGSYSPSLQRPIALILINKKCELNDQINIEIRNKLWTAKICSLPFYSKNDKNS